MENPLESIKSILNNKKQNSIYLTHKHAREYFNHIQTNPINSSEQKLLKKLFPELTNKNCLEIGCAGAIYSREMLKKKALEVHSIDYSAFMIEIAKSLTKNKVTYYHQDINREIRLKNTYDFICASYVLHYSKELDKTLTNIIQLLNPKGILIISVPNPKQFKQEENLLYLGNKKLQTSFYNHTQKKYLEILKGSGEILKCYENKDVFIMKFQKA